MRKNVDAFTFSHMPHDTEKRNVNNKQHVLRTINFQDPYNLCAAIV